MIKIAFLGAGSTIFAKNVLGDCLVAKELPQLEIALYDIDGERLKDSELMLRAINRKYRSNRKYYPKPERSNFGSDLGCL